MYSKALIGRHFVVSFNLGLITAPGGLEPTRYMYDGSYELTKIPPMAKIT